MSDDSISLGTYRSAPVEERALFEPMEDRFLLSTVVTMIDDFEVGPFNDSTSPPGLHVDSTAPADEFGQTGLPPENVLGGQRYLALTLDPISIEGNSATAKLWYNEATNDDLRWNNETDVASTLVVEYGRNPDGSLSPLNADLSSGGADAFEIVLKVDSVEHPVDVRLEITSGSTTAFADVTATSTTFVAVQIPFSSFSGIDFADVDLIRLIMTCPEGVLAQDANVDQICTIGEADIDIQKYVNYEQPEQGGEGLTPGFWKQPQHFYAWTGYTTDASYEDVFGVEVDGVPGSPTLLDALKAKGGGMYALLRHSTAALLNAANPYVSYAYTQAQIIQMVQDAFATGNFEGVKNLFEVQNELEADLTTLASSSSSGLVLPGYGDDADVAPGPTVVVGYNVVFTYVVTNTGAGELLIETIEDDNATADAGDDFAPTPVLAGDYNVGDTDQDGLLDPGESWVYETSTTAQEGTQTNTATVVATSVEDQAEVTDSDPASYTGIVPVPTATVSAAAEPAPSKPDKADNPGKGNKK